LSKEPAPKSPPRSSAKEFQPQLFKEEGKPNPSFQVTPLQMSAKKFSPQFGQYLKELEAKALQKAKERTLVLEKEAYEKGFDQGEKNGLELGHKRIETIVHQLNNLLAEIERQRVDLYKNYEEEMVRLVLTIAKKVLHHEVHIQEDVVAFALREAFQYVVDQKKVVVHLNPVDYQFLLAHRDQLPLGVEEGRGIRMIEDPAITRGGSLLETSFGDIDATIENQFDQIAFLVWQKMEQSGLPAPSVK
jgi:flagellar assembly protein FliH